MITCQNLQKEIEKIITVPDTNDVLFSNVNENFKQYFKDINIYYAWLTASVKIWKPKKIVELGAAKGASALALYLSKQPDTKLVSIDNNSSWPYFPSEVFNDKNVTLICSHDLDVNMITENKELLKNIDYLFIDTNHDYQQVKMEFDIYMEYLSNPALVVLDDIKINEGMVKFWNEITYDKIDISKYHDSGFGFFIFNK